VSELRNTRRDIELYFEYWDLRRTVSRRTPTGSEVVDGLSRNEAIAKLVDLHHKSPKTIEGVVDHYAKKYGPGDPLENPAFREP
jgi:hypothetical protein